MAAARARVLWAKTATSFLKMPFTGARRQKFREGELGQGRAPSGGNRLQSFDLSPEAPCVNPSEVEARRHDVGVRSAVEHASRRVESLQRLGPLRREGEIAEGIVLDDGGL